MALWERRSPKTPSEQLFGVNKAENNAVTRALRPSLLAVAKPTSRAKKNTNMEQTTVNSILPKKIKKSEDAAETSTNREKKFSILTAVYPLNSSRTKKILIGLYYDDAQRSFLPMVQFTNADYSNNIYMDGPTWSTVQNHFDTIARYFETNSTEKYP
jgi:hypothetical protein